MEEETQQRKERNNGKTCSKNIKKKTQRKNIETQT